MYRLKNLRRLGVIALATATLALTATPAQAASVGDPTGDVKWSKGTPTSAERARTDVTSVAYAMGDYNVRVRVKVRAWANKCSTGIPCSHVTTAVTTYFTNAYGKQITVDLQRSDAYGNTSYLLFPNYSTSTCESGQIKFTTSTTYDYVQIAIPRSCFPKGFHVTGGKTQLDYQTDKVIGDDFTSRASLNWVPKA